MTGGSLSTFNWAAGRTMTITGGSVTTGNLPGLAGNVINVSNVLLTCWNVELNGGGSATFSAGGRGSFRKLDLGSNGTGASMIVTGANSKFSTSVPFTNTWGSSSASAPTTVQILSGGALSMNIGSTLVLKPTATVNINGGAVSTYALNIDGGAMTFNSGTLSVGPSVSIGNGGKLDVTSKNMVVRGGDIGWLNGSSYTGITGLIAAGRNDGTWNGSGIVTSMSDATSSSMTTIAVAKAQDVGYAGGTFGGMSVNSGDVLLMYTWGGDADLNGQLDGDDYFQIDSNIASQPGGFHNGDFDYSGVIDGDDYFIIDSNITLAQNSPTFPTGAGGVAPVPEPSGLAGAALGVGLSARRRRRR